MQQVSRFLQIVRTYIAKRLPIWKTALRNARSSRVLRFIGLWLVSTWVLEVLLFHEILRDYNYLDIFPADITFPAAMHVVTGLAIAVITYFVPWLQSFTTKIFAAIILAFLLSIFNQRLEGSADLLRVVLPILPPAGSEMSVLSGILLMLFIAGCVCIARGINVVQRRYKVSSANCIVGLGIFLFVIGIHDVVQVVRVYLPTAQQAATQMSLPAKLSKSSVTEKPDIYYLVFDRYTSQKVLKNQYDYSNGSFLRTLKKEGFTTNNDAQSNYPFTDMSIASTLNANYLNSATNTFANNNIQSHTLYQNLVRNSSVIKALKQEGYTYHQIGNWYGTSNKAPLADYEHIAEQTIKIFGFTKHLRGIESLQFMQSPYYQLAKQKTFSWFTLDETKGISQPRAGLQALHQLATDKKQGGRFIFGHILTTHPPYYFNADGSQSAYYMSDDVGMSLRDKYINQIQYTNTEITKLIGEIKQSSGGRAVIVINSDEGPYPIESSEAAAKSFFASDMRLWNQNDLQKKFGILQTAYIPKATRDDLSKMSSVNIFRIILNRYAGYNLAYLPDCHYVLTDGRYHEYRQKEASSLLGKKRAEGCSP